MANSIAYGFLGLQELFNQRVAEVGTQRVYDAVQSSAAEYTRVIDRLLSEWAERLTLAQEQVELPGDGTLQPLDEWGNPLPILPSGSYKVAFPVQGGGTAWGTNRVSAAMLTVQESNRFTLDALARDSDWLMRHMLAAVFDNATWTYPDKVGIGGAKGLGDITIQPLANGDAVTYVRKGGTVATDTHYLAQAAAILDASNPFPTIYTDLMEHPSNVGPVKVYVPTDLVSACEALTNFVPVSDPDVAYGMANDRLQRSIDRGFGDRVMGKCDSSWLIEWGRLPSTHLIGHASGTPILGMREYPAAELQGFFPEQHSPDGNLVVNRMIRYAGFGVRNRVAALAYRIGNGSYAIPTGYDAPLPV
jgi:hypothetical protein